MGENDVQDRSLALFIILGNKLTPINKVAYHEKSNLVLISYIYI